MNKKLTNLIELSSNVKIYVPSTTGVFVQTDTTKYVDKTLAMLSDKFGGSTSYDAVGCWNSETGLVKEKVTVCESYCNTDGLEKNIDDIIAYCDVLKEDLTQEAIALEVNNKLYLI
jgi:hypothetical protein